MQDRRGSDDQSWPEELLLFLMQYINLGLYVAIVLVLVRVRQSAYTSGTVQSVKSLSQGQAHTAGKGP